jgi:Phage integrase family
MGHAGNHRPTYQRGPAAQVGDIDLDKRTITIQRGLERQKGKGLLFTSLKSATSRRNVLLMPMAVDALTRHRTRQKEQRLLVGPMWKDQGIVFASAIGTLLASEDVSRHFKDELTRVGLPKIRLHDLRHTAATLQLMQGTLIQALYSRCSVTAAFRSRSAPTRTWAPRCSEMPAIGSRKRSLRPRRRKSSAANTSATAPTQEPGSYKIPALSSCLGVTMVTMRFK